MEIRGVLWYNQEVDRYGILDENGGDHWIRDGLHCGEPLDVLIGLQWVSTRMEVTSSGKWCLVGLPGYHMTGATVRLC